MTERDTYVRLTALVTCCSKPQRHGQSNRAATTGQVPNSTPKQLSDLHLGRINTAIRFCHCLWC